MNKFNKYWVNHDLLTFYDKLNLLSDNKTIQLMPPSFLIFRLGNG